MKRPLFSIIVPTYKRSTQIEACLLSLAALEFPRDRFEVLVVDDGSDVPLAAMVTSFQGTINVSLLLQRHAGPAAARNTGAARATGRYLAFTDDDCAPAPDWLKMLEKNFNRMPDCAIGGQTINALPNNRYSTASQLLIDYLYTYHHSNRHPSRFFTSNNVAFPANSFRAVGGFDASFTQAAAEDRELCDRWLQSGFELIYAPEVKIHHAHQLSAWTFWKQHYRYGKGAARFHTLSTYRDQPPIQLEPLSFYLNMIGFPFKAANGKSALSLAVLLSLSQVANAVGFWRGPHRHSSLRFDDAFVRR